MVSSAAFKLLSFCIISISSLQVDASACNGNNCLNALQRYSVTASSFCSTSTTNKAIPTPWQFLAACGTTPSKVLSACSCINTAPTTSSTSSSSSSSSSIPILTCPPISYTTIFEVLPPLVTTVNQTITETVTPDASTITRTDVFISTVTLPASTITTPAYTTTVIITNIPAPTGGCGVLPNPYTTQNGVSYNEFCSTTFNINPAVGGNEIAYLPYPGMPDFAACMEACRTAPTCIAVDWYDPVGKLNGAAPSGCHLLSATDVGPTGSDFTGFWSAKMVGYTGP